MMAIMHSPSRIIWLWILKEICFCVYLIIWLWILIQVIFILRLHGTMTMMNNWFLLLFYVSQKMPRTTEWQWCGVCSYISTMYVQNREFTAAYISDGWGYRHKGFVFYNQLTALLCSNPSWEPQKPLIYAICNKWLSCGSDMTSVHWQIRISVA